MPGRAVREFVFARRAQPAAMVHGEAFTRRNRAWVYSQQDRVAHERAAPRRLSFGRAEFETM